MFAQSFALRPTLNLVPRIFFVLETAVSDYATWYPPDKLKNIFDGKFCEERIMWIPRTSRSKIVLKFETPSKQISVLLFSQQKFISMLTVGLTRSSRDPLRSFSHSTWFDTIRHRSTPLDRLDRNSGKGKSKKGVLFSITLRQFLMLLFRS